MKKFSNFGFTLAEILIIIGIIGVISALTILNLWGLYNVSISQNKFKKNMAVLNQMGKMANSEFGYDFTTLQKPSSLATCKDEHSNDFSICGLVNDSIKGATYLGLDNEININDKKKWSIKTSSYVMSYILNFRYYIWQLPDGSLIGFNSMLGYRDVNYNRNCVLEAGNSVDQGWVSSHWWCIGYIDTNGVDYPNQEVSCSNKSITTSGSTAPCSVKKDLDHVTDIYPFILHDNIVVPATNASTFLFR